MYERRFGSLRNAYALIGYARERLGAGVWKKKGSYGAGYSPLTDRLTASNFTLRVFP